MLKRSGLYRAFLKHRVWTAKAIQRAHILYWFPLGTLYFLWIALPHAVLSVAWLMICTKFLDSSTVLGATEFRGIIVVTLTYYALVWPIVFRVLWDTFRGFFAGFLALFKQLGPVVSLQRDTQTDLDEWDRTYV